MLCEKTGAKLKVIPMNLKGELEEVSEKIPDGGNSDHQNCTLPRRSSRFKVGKLVIMVTKLGLFPFPNMWMVT